MLMVSKICSILQSSLNSAVSSYWAFLCRSMQFSNTNTAVDKGYLTTGRESGLQLQCCICIHFTPTTKCSLPHYVAFTPQVGTLIAWDFCQFSPNINTSQCECCMRWSDLWESRNLDYNWTLQHSIEFRHSIERVQVCDQIISTEVVCMLFCCR